MTPFLVLGIPNAVGHFMLHTTLTKERAALEMCHGNIGHLTLLFMRSFVQGPQLTVTVLGRHKSFTVAGVSLLSDDF